MPLIKELLVVITIMLALVEGKACGPQGKRRCSSERKMNCTETGSHLKIICSGLSNQTYKLWAEQNDYLTLRRSDLKGCERLKSLFLKDNIINLLENCTFCDLKHLEELDLSNNSLDLYQILTRQAILFPESLMLLKLNGNVNNNSSGTHYPDLSYLNRLHELHMDGLSNQSFPTTYTTIKSLTKVVLSGQTGYCSIPNITNETFSSLVHVRTLNISVCNITRIEAGAFENMRALEVLDISGNTQLGFRLLANVTYSLQFTNIKSLNASRVHSAFGMGTKLQKRDICYLYNTSILEIVLNDNRMEMFETNAAILVPLTLNIFQVEHNKFTFAPYILQIGCVGNMTTFYGNHQNSPHNPLLFDEQPQYENDDNWDVFPNTCPYMKEEFLRTEGNRRKYCHYFEPGKSISIRDNFPTMPKSLKHISFASCAMVYTVPNFLALPPDNQLEFMDFSGNVLTSLEGPVGPFPNLKYVNLSKNYCSYLGLDFFNGAKAITDLQLDRNFLGMLLADEYHGSHVFRKLGRVKTLNLSSNIISYLPKSTFSKVLALETLDLSSNNIDKWTLDVDGLNNLLHLYLMRNFFQALPEALRVKLEENSKRLNKSFSIDIRNNSITVSCDNRHFLEWMVDHRDKFVAFHENSFQDPSGTPISADHVIDQVLRLRKECASYTLEIVLGTIGVSVFLAIVVGGVIYRNRWNLRYLMRSAKIRYFGYKRLQDYLPDENYRNDVFISYANEDYQFVVNEILARLENQGLRLCLHDRDFLPGENIADNIINAIRNSRTTLIVLSPDFLKSKWCLYEFNMARMESIYSRAGSNCLLFIMYRDVHNENMPTEMLEWIRTNTYLEYSAEEPGVHLFWDNLKEALLT